MKMYVESERGHDEIDVPKGEEQKAVEGQLKDGKWVTLEKEDGATEILTEEDMPEEDEEEEQLDTEDKELLKEAGDWKGTFGISKPGVKPIAAATKPATPVVREEWKSKFDDVKTATATHKAKGG